jgi:hypothetical protein
MPIPLLVPVVLAGGGIAYVAATQKGATPPTALVNGRNQTTGGGGTVPVPGLVAAGGTRPVGAHHPYAAYAMARPVISGSHQDPDPMPGPGYDPNLPPWSITGQKLDMIEAAAKKAYDGLASDAKARAASVLSDQLGIDPPLNGSESWDTLETVTESAIGAAAGGAIGGPIGAKLGAICSAYLGQQLNDLLNKNLDDLQDWLGDQWGAAKQYVEDQLDQAGNALESGANDAYNYVSSLV